jgi:hypothetical protein
VARIRTIKPGFFQHEELSSLSAETHLLAAGLLCHADDAGLFLAHPKLIQAAVFPLRELSGNIPEELRSLQEIGFIMLGTGADGKRYGKITKFIEHQKISHPSKSWIEVIPIDWNNSGNLPESSCRPPETLRPEMEMEMEMEREMERDISSSLRLDGHPPVEPKKPPVSESNRELDKLLLPVWEYYLEKTGRNGVIYSLTDLRKAKGRSRLKECLLIANSPDSAQKLMMLCVDAICASDFHMGRDPKTGGKKYCEWEAHVFKTQEQTQRWLYTAQAWRAGAVK